MIDKIKSLLLNRLFIGYALIGITGVALDVISYIFFINSGIAPVLAAILSTSLGIINNFLLNSFYNFRKRDRMIIRFIKFYGVGLVGILLTATLIYILHDKIGIGPLVAKLMTIPPVVLIQFLLNKHVSFSDKSVRKFVLSLKVYKRIIVLSLSYLAIPIIGLAGTAMYSSGYTWDVGIFQGVIATYIETGNVPSEDDYATVYMSMYQNNVPPIVILLSGARLIHNIFNVDALASLVILNVAFIALSFYIVLFLSYKIFGFKGFLSSYAIGLILIVCSSYVAIPYTDTMAMAAISSMILLAYLTTEGKAMRMSLYVLVGVVLCLGYLFKPTTILITLPLLFYVCVQLLKGKITLKRQKIYLLAAILVGMLFSFGAYRALVVANDNIGQYSEAVLERYEKDALHFIAMGTIHNEEKFQGCNKGAFCQAYIDSVSESNGSFDTRDDRKKYELQVIKDNIKEGFPFAISTLMAKKIFLAYNDGSFGAWREGVNDNVKFYNNDVISVFIRSFLGVDGKYAHVYKLIQMIVWMTVLAVILIGMIYVALKKVRISGLVYPLLIGILLMTAFLAVSESRARYFFMYLPVFIVLGQFIVSSIINKKKG